MIKEKRPAKLAAKGGDRMKKVRYYFSHPDSEKPVVCQARFSDDFTDEEIEKDFLDWLVAEAKAGWYEEIPYKK